MKRLLSTIQLDMMLQRRSKLYHIAIGLALLLALVMRQFMDREALRLGLPLFYLFAIGGTAYYFVAGMVIFEKGEHTLDAQTITPLRTGEYLIAKAVSLWVVVLIESVIVLLVTYGWGGFNPLLLFAGVTVMALGLTLGGFVQVSRYDSVTDFLVPSLAVTLVLQLPFLHLLEIAPSAIWYLIPSMAPTLLMRAAFAPIAAWEMIYAIGYSLLILAGMFWWARRAYYHNIALRAG